MMAVMFSVNIVGGLSPSIHSKFYSWLNVVRLVYLLQLREIARPARLEHLFLEVREIRFISIYPLKVAFFHNFGPL